MSNTLSKVLNVILGLLLGLSAVLTVVFYVTNADISTEASFSSQIEQMGAVLQYYLYWMYLLAGIAAASAILFPLIGLFTDLKSALKTLIFLAIVAVIVGIAYSMADDTVMKLPGYQGSDNVPSRIKFAGTILHTLYFIAGLSVLSILYSEIAKLFK